MPLPDNPASDSERRDLNSANWRRVSDVFDQAIETPPENRHALLDDLCAGDPNLRQQVENLLIASDRRDRFERDVGAVVQNLASEWHSDHYLDAVAIGTRIGPWRVLGEQGRGGMGVVMRGERADGQFELRVAIKLLAFPTAGLVQRFSQERHILAQLQHPHIARLLDGGLTQNDVPYFVMEFVDGIAITAYCRQNNATLRERLALMLDVCDAVQHAHAGDIVHRDIKPSNILVNEKDGPKLLDFGVAKILTAVGDGATPGTLPGGFTVEYAAPEQLAGTAIMPATDVYALGVVLYELICGKRPREVLHERGRTDETVVERQIIAPCTLLPRDAIDSATRRIRDDLDRIVLKALAYDADDRYETAGSLGADLRRLLDGRPVTATSRGYGYRLQKFFHRHTAWSVVVVVLGLIALATAFVARQQSIVTTQQIDETRLTSQYAQFENDLHVTAASLLSNLKIETRKDGRAPSSMEELRRVAQRLLETPTIGDSQRIAMATVIATDYLSMDHAASAAALLDSVLQSTAESERTHFALSMLKVTRAEAAAELGQIDLAQRLLDETRPTIDRLASHGLLKMQLSAALVQSRILVHTARTQDANRLLQNLLTQFDTPEFSDTIVLAELLSTVARRTTDSERASKLDQRAYRIVAATFGEDSAAAMDAQRALLLRSDAAWDVAAPIFERQERVIRASFGDDSPDLADVQTSRCSLLLGKENYDQGEPYCRQAMTILEKTEEAQSPALAGAYDNEAESLMHTGHPAQALALYQREVTIRERTSDENLVFAQLAVAVAQCRAGNTAAAVEDFAPAIAEYEKQLGASHPYVAVNAARIASCLLDSGKLDAAKTIMKDHGRIDPPRPGMSSVDRANIQAVWDRLTY